MFERRKARLLSRRKFALRMASLAAVALGFTAVSLAAGMAGYHGFEGLAWRDAFLNAAMILGGMGPVDPVRTDAGKLFAGLYALYSGLWVVASMGLLLAPVFHRILHHFHAEGGRD